MRRGEPTAWLAIVALAVGAAVVYGVVHDQVTVRICEEYFTIMHEPLFNTDSPTLLALGWGVVASWWVGLPAGILLAIAARVGEKQPVRPSELLRPLATLLAMMAITAALAGWMGYALARRGVVRVPAEFSDLLPEDTQQRFMADWWAHNASYAVGIVGGLVLCLRVYRERKPQVRGAARASARGSR